LDGSQIGIRYLCLCVARLLCLYLYTNDC